METTSSFDDDRTDQILQQNYEEGTCQTQSQSSDRVRDEEDGDQGDKTQKYGEYQDDREAHRTLQGPKSRHDPSPILENLIRPFFNSSPEEEENPGHVSDCFRDQMSELRSPAQSIPGRASSYLQILRLHVCCRRKRSISAPAQPHSQQPQQRTNYSGSTGLDEVRIHETRRSRQEKQAHNGRTQIPSILASAPHRHQHVRRNA